jgi:hypothetical protein
VIVVILTVAGHKDCESYNDDCQQCVVEGCTFCKALYPSLETYPYRCRDGNCTLTYTRHVCRPEPNFDKTKSCDEVGLDDVQ